ncbi:MAG: hypothetical protein AB1630_06940 [bacterium]
MIQCPIYPLWGNVQFPNPNVQSIWNLSLGFGHWDFVCHWSLGFGILFVIGIWSLEFVCHWG